jgi:hypothetical protein
MFPDKSLNWFCGLQIHSRLARSQNSATRSNSKPPIKLSIDTLRVGLPVALVSEREGAALRKQALREHSKYGAAGSQGQRASGPGRDWRLWGDTLRTRMPLSFRASNHA